METLEQLKNLPKGQVITFSLKPEGEKIKVRISCQFFVMQDKYETIESQIRMKILEIEKIIKEAESKGWLKPDISQNI